MSFPLRIFLITGFLLLCWLGTVQWAGWEADLAESNLQANLLRISRYLGEPKPEVVLVGSSVGGRLLPSYFAEHGAKVLNLGLDGSRPLFGFEVLDAGRKPPATVLLDTSALFQPLGENDIALRDAMTSPTARMDKVLPFFRPESRPSSVIYNQFKSIRDSLGSGKARNPRRPGPAAASFEIPATYSEVADRIRELQKRGTRVVILDIPRGEGWAEPAQGAVAALAAEIELPILEPGPAIYAREGDMLRFSDGLHLDAPSARKVSAWLSGNLPLARQHEK